jgi:glycosyltransferase involved in cell wall biosynthesis
MPLISVIIPVYNGETTIQRTIESVFKQTVSDWELIVIDDGSQDSTVDILSQIRDSRLKVFSYPNAGQATSRNRGLAKASGDYIAFLDADDLWTPDKLEAQLNALQTHPQAAVAYSWTDYIDESDQFYRRGNHLTLNGNIYANLLLTDLFENGSNLLICKKALDDVGGFDESLPPAEDWELWLRLASRYEFIAVPSAQILYRVSAHSASTQVGKMEAACLRVIEQAFSQAPESLQYLKKNSIANLYKYLTFKVLESSPARHQGITALGFFRQVILNDPSILRTGVSWKVLFKSMVFTLLPNAQAEQLLKQVSPIANTTTLLGYIQTHVS